MQKPSTMKRWSGSCFALIVVAACAVSTGATAQNTCQNPVYLTFEAGNMEAAPFVAAALRRQGVKATFFAANERTVQGDGSLGNYWAPWWKARGAEGHEFASNTYDRVFWRGDLPGRDIRFRMEPSAGALTDAGDASGSGCKAIQCMGTSCVLDGNLHTRARAFTQGQQRGQPGGAREQQQRLRQRRATAFDHVH